MECAKMNDATENELEDKNIYSEVETFAVTGTGVGIAGTYNKITHVYQSGPLIDGSKCTIKTYDVDEFMTNENGLLGRGCSGEVWQCFHRSLGAVAVKCRPVFGSSRTMKNAAAKLKKEIENLSYAQHRNIIQFYGVTEVKNHWVGLAMEYLPAGSLFDLIVDDDVTTLPFPLRHQFCKDIADGIRFLHGDHEEKRMVHGDLKLENVLLTRNLVCKIADLGSARISTITGLSSISSGLNSTGHTPMYAAPEIQRGNFHKITKASDMFSFGVIIELILSRCTVRSPAPIQEKLSELKEDQDQRCRAIIDCLGSLATKLCRENQQERPTIKAVQDELKSVDGPSPDEVSACVTQVLKNYTIDEVDSSEDFVKMLKDIDMSRIQQRDEWATNNLGGMQGGLYKPILKPPGEMEPYTPDESPSPPTTSPPEQPASSQPPTTVAVPQPSPEPERKSTVERVGDELKRTESKVRNEIDRFVRRKPWKKW